MFNFTEMELYVIHFKELNNCWVLLLICLLLVLVHYEVSLDLFTFTKWAKILVSNMKNSYKRYVRALFTNCERKQKMFGFMFFWNLAIWKFYGYFKFSAIGGSGRYRYNLFSHLYAIISFKKTFPYYLMAKTLSVNILLCI